MPTADEALRRRILSARLKATIAQRASQRGIAPPVAMSSHIAPKFLLGNESPEVVRGSKPLLLEYRRAFASWLLQMLQQARGQNALANEVVRARFDVTADAVLAPLYANAHVSADSFPASEIDKAACMELILLHYEGCWYDCWGPDGIIEKARNGKIRLAMGPDTVMKVDKGAKEPTVTNVLTQFDALDAIGVLGPIPACAVTERKPWDDKWDTQGDTPRDKCVEGV